ncbi:MAG: glycolate oxidase subunit GlcF [Polymorphobacter sp.]
MRTQFTDAQRAEPAVARSEAAIRKCVHCGFCTATCPTYVLHGDERDSPRGRIALIQNMIEAGGPPTAATVRHVDRCLSCLACTTTCPSGVDYAQLIDHGRAHIEAHYRRPWHDRLLRRGLAAVLPYPARFRAALALAPLGRLFQPWLARHVATRPLAAMLALAPRSLPAPMTTPAKTLPATTHQHRVLMLRGCAEPVLAPQIQAATVRLFDRMGIGVDQVDDGCCGALVHHIGQEAAAQAMARANIERWEAALASHDYAAIIVTASGCGSQLKAYGKLLADDPDFAARAARIAALARDWSEIVAANALPPRVAGQGLRIAYHAACSLQHGQRVDAPRALLVAAGFDVVVPGEAHLCCGSAGTYNILQSEIAAALRDRKQAALAATGATLVASGNIGCLTQLAGAALPLVHSVELLDWATGGPLPPALPLALAPALAATLPGA